ncbi:MAG TPA: hypothetical protein DEQ06_08600 [Porphyromonadaceae bacterium]|nr:hypothetical protein [Porphyromonadaceae bacterium]
MKRKNLFFVSALILFGLANVNSAMAQPQSDDATVNIKFRPVQSIVVNPAQKSVDLLYATKDNYANGVTAERPDHLEVFSTGGFTVTANTGGDFTRAAGGTIDAGDVTVIAALGTSTTIGSFTDVALSTTPQTLITANEGGTALMYNVTYDNTAGGGNVYINNYIHPDSPESVYTATVTYTIATN